MGDVPKLPRPSTDTIHWRDVIECRRWAGIDDKALLPALIDHDSTVDPKVLAGVVLTHLHLSKKTVTSVAIKSGLTDKAAIDRVVDKVLHDVNEGMALPRSSNGVGFKEAFFGRLVNLATAEIRKIRRRRRIEAGNGLADVLWMNGSAFGDAPDKNLMREDVLRGPRHGGHPRAETDHPPDPERLDRPRGSRHRGRDD